MRPKLQDIILEYKKNISKHDCVTKVIIVSRQPFCGGRPFSEKLADQTGSLLIDKEILTIAGSLSDSSFRQKIIQLDEKPLSFIDNFIHNFMNGLDFDTQYKLLKQAFYKLAYENKKLVFLGRGMQYMKENEKVKIYRIRLVADNLDRAVILRNDNRDINMRGDEAFRLIKKLDEEHQNYLNCVHRFCGYNHPPFDLEIEIKSAEKSEVDRAIEIARPKINEFFGENYFIS